MDDETTLEELEQHSVLVKLSFLPEPQVATVSKCESSGVWLEGTGLLESVEKIASKGKMAPTPDDRSFNDESKLFVPFSSIEWIVA